MCKHLLYFYNTRLFSKVNRQNYNSITRTELNFKHCRKILLLIKNCLLCTKKDKSKATYSWKSYIRTKSKAQNWKYSIQKLSLSEQFYCESPLQYFN